MVAAKGKKKGKIWLERVMRLGFAANGIIYMTIGILALQTAFGVGGETTGRRGALREIANQPLGQFLIAVVAVGLVGLAAWHVLRGVLDMEADGSDAVGLSKRVGYGIAGLLQAGLAVIAIQILIGDRSGGSRGIEEWTARLLQQPFGRWLVILAAGITVIVGLAKLYGAYKAKFKEKLRSDEMSEREIRWSVYAGRLGIAAQGVVSLLIGLFLGQAAYQHDAQKAGGLAQALETLLQQPYGSWLLAMLAFGLIAYGLFAAVVLLRYRHIPILEKWQEV